MKYYIATSLSKVSAHNAVRDTLQSLGHEISYDWTLHGSVKSTSTDRLREVALSELKGILEADFVVVLLPGGKGTHTELGFALANGKKVFLQSEEATPFEVGPETCAFYHHPDLERLCCPMAEVAAKVHLHLLQPVGSHFRPLGEA